MKNANLINDYQMVNNELELYASVLADRPRCVINKIDMPTPKKSGL